MKLIQYIPLQIFATNRRVADVKKKPHTFLNSVADELSTQPLTLTKFTPQK
jgi:hypothetical protein